MAATSAKENPFTPFSRLSPSVYLREPTTTSINNGNPAIIVICFFMDAPPRILVKYVTEYVRLAPSARIIFILSSASDLLLRPTTASAQRHLTPAVEAIRASADPERPVFFHIFSNGGTLTALRLLVAYRDITGEPMPVSWMIIDSAPGKITRAQDSATLAITAINDAKLFNGQVSAKKRCYIYSDADDLAHWRDMEAHAADAEAKGWVVECERSHGSPHVRHMRADPARYWGIVRRYLKDASAIKARETKQ
ncbi:hypothetical protein M432DRAFT_593471 [Thermoascus aurantiacus ATCC 26904]